MPQKIISRLEVSASVNHNNVQARFKSVGKSSLHCLNLGCGQRAPQLHNEFISPAQSGGNWTAAGLGAVASVFRAILLRGENEIVMKTTIDAFGAVVLV